MKTEQEVAEFLSHASQSFADVEEVDVTVTSFREGMVLTNNEGFTLRFGNPGGPEYQVRVVRSK